MNLNFYSTKAYENIANWTLGENKPNSNPIKPNYRRARMNVNSLITKDYRKKDDFAVRKNKPNSNPISVKPKMSANLYVIEDYENETAFRPQKNKPKQSQFQTGHQPPPTPYLPQPHNHPTIYSHSHPHTTHRPIMFLPTHHSPINQSPSYEHRLSAVASPKAEASSIDHPASRHPTYPTKLTTPNNHPLLTTPPSPNKLQRQIIFRIPYLPQTNKMLIFKKCYFRPIYTQKG